MQQYFNYLKPVMKRAYGQHMTFSDFSLRLAKKNVPTMILFFKND